MESIYIQIKVRGQGMLELALEKKERRLTLTIFLHICSDMHDCFMNVFGLDKINRYSAQDHEYES